MRRMKLVGFGFAFVSAVLLFQNCGEGFQALSRSGGQTFQILKFSSVSSEDEFSSDNAYHWNGSDPAINHQVGQASGTAWAVGPATQSGYLNFGPYSKFSQTAAYKVQFTIKATVNPGHNHQFLVLDVNSPETNQVVTSREVWTEEFNSNSTQVLTLVFRAEAGRSYEFRSRLTGGGVGLQLEKISVGRADEGLLGEFFNGRSVPAEIGKVPSAEGWIFVQNGVWYNFGRDFLPDSETPSYCHLGPDARSIGLGVRISHDKGKTWSGVTRIATPTRVRGQDDACTILDGTTFFNDEVGKFQILSQCIGEDGTPWKLCLYQSAALTGPYSRVQNFSFRAREIADLTCVPGSACPTGKVYDEGTPEFIDKKHGYYYFTFHGYDGVRGYRLIARTRDFSGWQVKGAGLPGDALFTPADCATWDYGPHGSCIGGGAASVMHSGDFIYMLMEAPTVNLLCTPGQFWPIGLIRSYQMEKSGHWESSSVNPVIKPVPGMDGCAIQYAKFFRDGDDVYMHYFRYINKNLDFQVPLFYVGKERPGGAAVQPKIPVADVTDFIFVETQYKNILKRTPKGEEVQYYVNQLQAKLITRAYIQAHFNAVCAQGQETCGGVSTAKKACSHNGQSISHGASVVAYLASSVPSGSFCSPQTRTCQDGVLSGSATASSCVVQAPQIGNEDFIRSAYLSILKRPATTADIQFYNSQLVSGAFTRDYIQTHFYAQCVNGTELCGKAAPVPVQQPVGNPTPVYEPAPAPVVLTDRDFLNVIYQTVLMRPADAVGMNFYLNELQSGRMSRNQIQAHFYSVCRDGTERCGR